MSTPWQEEIARLPDVLARFDVPLAAYTSLAVGGPAECLAEPSSPEAAAKVLRLACRHNVPVFFLGNGTNLLPRDGGVAGIALHLGPRLAALRVADTRITAQAGASLSALTHLAANHSLSGLEFLAGVPGTVGGAIVMNAGAWGREIGDTVRRVRVADLDGRVSDLAPADLDFGYRHSALQDGRRLVLEAEFELRHGDRRRIMQEMFETVERRCRRQPISAASAGSTFERPPGEYAGRLIEKVGAKGMCVGDAAVSTKHANFILNRGHATASDIIRLIDRVRHLVQKEYGVWLETEVRIIGRDATMGTEPLSGLPHDRTGRRR